MPLIQVEDLNKEYRIVKKEEGIRGSIKHLIKPNYFKKIAVDNITFSIEKGESVAFLGANGAGKSTTIKMLTGILRPTQGSIQIMGRNPFEDRIENVKNIGVVFGQKSQLWLDIPVIESFLLLKNIYNISDEQYAASMEQFKKILELHEFLEQPARKLSLGQRVRADIAAALLHRPGVLFLDEPTIGLDVAVKQKVYDLLKYFNKSMGTTILLTSHDLNDLEKLCQRLIIMERGVIIFDDKIQKIYEQFKQDTTLEEIVIRIFNRRSK